MKKLFFILATLTVLSACADSKPMDDAERDRILHNMQSSEVYH